MAIFNGRDSLLDIQFAMDFLRRYLRSHEDKINSKANHLTETKKERALKIGVQSLEKYKISVFFEVVYGMLIF